MSPPTVSVIVPCYRYADLLEGCVASVLSQDGVDVRVLIVDDCSPMTLRPSRVGSRPPTRGCSTAITPTTAA